LELGLPQTALGLGLLFFNIGVELGQIAFILLLLLIGAFYRLLQRQLVWQGKDDFWYQQKLFSPVIGSVAAFWVIQRLEDFI